MKRSEINSLIEAAERCFGAHGCALPPNPHWDVTDFGLGKWRDFGLVLVNLAEEPEYCEKVMYAQAGMTTPAHTHRQKKEDIICRWGRLAVRLWSGHPNDSGEAVVNVRLNQLTKFVASGSIVELDAGSRVTLLPGVYHEFYPLSEECIIGEISTANNDRDDNFFVDPEIGRFPEIDEDEPAQHQLISDSSQ